MSREIAVFKNPSDIIFKTDSPKVPVVTVAHAKRGNTFLHKGAVCMLTEVSAYQALNAEKSSVPVWVQEKVQTILKEAIFVTNLQTGRTFAAKPDDEIEWVRVTMTVESVK